MWIPTVVIPQKEGNRQLGISEVKNQFPIHTAKNILLPFIASGTHE